MVYMWKWVVILDVQELYWLSQSRVHTMIVREMCARFAFGQICVESIVECDQRHNHRLTYIHILRPPLWIHTNTNTNKCKNICFIFLNLPSEQTNNEEASSSSYAWCLHPRLPLHLVLGLQIRVSADIPNLSQNPNFDHILVDHFTLIKWNKRTRMLQHSW